jgi:hypothetical protein
MDLPEYDQARSSSHRLESPIDGNYFLLCKKPLRSQCLLKDVSYPRRANTYELETQQLVII